MSNYINIFLKTELTGIPKFLDKCIGKYYNNALCNGATWMFIIWYLLHITFDEFLNALLKKMKFVEYVRIRLKNSLWYLGFYGSALIYCFAVFHQNNIPFFTVKPTAHSVNAPSGQLILGFIVLSTFFLHSAFWECLKNGRSLPAVTYLCLFLQLFLLYFSRFIEGSFRLTILISIAQIFVEIARCATLLIQKSFDKNNIISTLFLIMSVFAFIFNYVFVIPILLGYPLVQSLSPTIVFISLLQLAWLGLEIHTSVCKKFIMHYYYHFKKSEQGSIVCRLDYINCSLFEPRDDEAFMLNTLLKDKKDREETEMKLRKPKSRSTVMQALKCMVTIKRKLNEKRKLNRASNDTEEDCPCDKSEDEDEDAVNGKLEFNIQRNNFTPKSKDD